MYNFKIFFYFFISFQSIHSQCLFTYEDSYKCLLCDYLHYDDYFYRNMKLSIEDNKMISPSDCLPKIQVILQRKIYIMAENSSYQDSNGNSIYDEIYSNISFALQEESQIFSKYLYGNLTIILENGIHYIENDKDNEYFRRCLVDITIENENNDYFNKIIMNCSYLYIFISKNLYIRNMIFENIICNSLNLLILTNYGLFNLEYIFDNTNALEIPYLSIINCSFNSFSNSLYTSLFFLAPLSSVINIYDTNISSCFFSNGLFVEIENFDNLYIYLYKYINRYNYLSKFNQSINIVNVRIFRYGLCDNDSNTSNIFNLNNFYGNIMINALNLLEIYNFSSIFSIQNTDRASCLSINNSNFTNITNTIVFDISNIYSIVLSNSYIENCNYNNNGSFFYIYNSYSLILSNFSIYFIQCKMLFELITNTAIVLHNTKFLNLSITNGLYLYNSNITINLSIFADICYTEQFFSLYSSYDFLLINSTLIKIKGNYTLFTFSSQKYIIVSSSKLSNIYTFSLFSLFYGLVQIIYKTIFSNNSIASIWENDPDCLLILLYKSLIQYNFISYEILSNSYIKTTDIIFRDSLILDNNYTAVTMMMVFDGNLVFDRIAFINNIMLDPVKFDFAFDFESDLKTYINNSFFQDNGLIQRKVFYLSKTDNCLFSNWRVSSSFYNALTVVITRKTEMASGVISAVPHEGYIEISNCLFVVLSTNPLLTYKGFYLDTVINGIFKNNNFYNLKCNENTFFHSKGSFLITGSSSYNYIKNDYYVYFSNKTFWNCSCGHGGALAIVGVNTIILVNMNFYNSTSLYDGGHLFFISIINIIFNNISLINSEGYNGGGIYIFNVCNFTIFHINLSNSLSHFNGGFYCQTVSNLSIYKSSFNQNEAISKGGVFCLFDTFILLHRSMIYNSKSLYAGGIGYFSRQSQLDLNMISIENATAYIGGMFYIDDIKDGIFSLIDIKGIKAISDGAGFFIDIAIIIRIIGLFMNEGKTDGNGFIFVKSEDDMTTIMIMNVVVRKSNVFMGSFIYYLSVSRLFMMNITILSCSTPIIFITSFFTININMNNILIINTFDENYLLYASGADLSINKLTITIGYLYHSCFYLTDMNVNLSYIRVYNISNEFFVFEINDVFINFNDIIMHKGNISFISSINSSISLKNANIAEFLSYYFPIMVLKEGNSILEDINMSHNGVLEAIESSDIYLTIRRGVFINNSQNKPNIQISYIMNDNTANIALIEDINISIYASSSAISASGGSFIVTINECSFSNKNLNNSNKISGLFLINTGILTINKSFFKNFSENAIFIENDNNILIISILETYFLGNIGSIGSAIYIIGTTEFTANIYNCSFIENKAISYYGIAPCIYFYSKSPMNNKVSIEKSVFYGNIAEFISPTIMGDSGIDNIDSNSFKNNQDFFNFTSKFSTNLLYFKIMNISNDEDPIVITSGNSFDLLIKIVDYYNQTLIFDNKTIISLKSSQNLQIFIQSNVCQSKRGVFLMKGNILKVRSNFTFFLNLEGTFLEILDENRRILIPSQNILKKINFYSRICRIGEILKDDLSCLICPNGSYSFKDPMITDVQQLKCNNCPVNADCFAGQYLTPKAGYYRYSNLSIDMIQCIASDACLGFIGTLYEHYCDENCKSSVLVNGGCLNGSYGELCYYCKFEYFKIDGVNCVSCKNIPGQFYMQTLFIIAVSVLFLLANGISAETLTYKEGLFENFNALNKIFVNHFQQIVIIFNAKSISLSFIPSLINVVNFFSFPLDFLNNKCILQSIYLFDPEVEFILKAIIFIITPFIISFFAAFFRLFVSLIQKFIIHKRNYDLLSLREVYIKFRLYMVISIFMYYPQIIKSYLSFFNCFKLDQNIDSTFLKISPKIECWKNYHLKIVLMLGVPGICFCAIISQIYLYSILRRYRNIALNAHKNVMSFLKKSDSKEYNKSNIHIDDVNRSGENRNKENESNSSNTSLERDRKKNQKNVLLFFKKNLPDTNSLETNKKNEFNQFSYAKRMTYKNMESLFDYYQDLKINVTSHSRISKNDESKVENLCSALSINKHFTDNNQKLRIIKKTIQTIKESRVFSFFYKDLKEKFYYWECTIFLRKFFLCVFVNLPEILPEEISFFFLLWILLIVLVITVFNKPYLFDKANNLETYSIFVCIFTLMASIILNSNNANENFRLVIAAFCFCFNVHFVLMGLIYSFCDVKKRMKGRKVGGVYKNFLRKIIRSISRNRK